MKQFIEKLVILYFPYLIVGICYLIDLQVKHSEWLKKWFKRCPKNSRKFYPRFSFRKLDSRGIARKLHSKVSV